MKSVLYEEIDGFKIINGFDNLLINPIETKEMLLKEIIKTESYKKFASYMIDVRGKMEQAHKAGVNSSQAVNEPERKKFFLEREMRLEDIKKIQEMIKEHLPKLKIEEKEIIIKKAIYFIPRSNEKGIKDTKFKELKEKISLAFEKGKLITIDGDEIENNAGKTFYNKVSDKWNITRIDKLGIKSPKDSKEYNLLTNEEKNEVNDQIKINQINKASLREKEIMKNQELEGAITRASTMRSQLEIQGDVDALKKSQSWYKKEIKLIEDRYK